ncbi:AMP-binding protein [Aromatoleum toluclasticum]|uniref:AMP-binding protein n=1 Tax=Aromatoleum toluclasticum TaxID=92003 RepID=UPI001D181678|nr:AMP-binding protein [Aromatoleum toluclasticum]MCC4117601.1 AMP-binding protein [Aromatoleum toluclasticum]
MTSRTFSLADLFAIAAETVPERDALVIGASRYTYGQMAARIERLAAWLHGQGIGAGDVVGLQMYNSAEYLEAFLAACRVRAIPANINYRYVADELRYLYDNAGPKALFYSAELEPAVAEALDAAPGLRAKVRTGTGTPALADATPYDETLTADPSVLRDVHCRDDDISLLYTGGTTGKPKGVMWPHKDLFFGSLGGGASYVPAEGPIATPEQLADRIRKCAPMRFMPVAPLMHGAAHWATMVSLFAGHTVVLNEQRHFNAEHILDLIVRERVNGLTIVGDAMAVPLLDALNANPTHWDLSTLFIFGNGGAVLSNHLKETLKAYLPQNVFFSDGMGSSEGGQLGLGSKPADGGMIRIAARPDLAVIVDGNRLAAPGEQGILARSGYLPLGYYGDPEKTAQTFVTLDGKRYVLTGDAAKLADDGAIIIYGRGSNCINTGGEKVFPEEVEEVLRMSPDVFDAIVVGLPDPRWGQKVVAVVAPRPGLCLDPQQLRALCQQHMANYKIPKDIVLVPEVKRSAAGKANYPWAREVAGSALNY